jgi:3-hydroxyisobutyrate dehydrogenase-like beta-hydroxyacid dehydrogenase
MTTIALLGTGLLGAGMVENLLGKGHTVRIWNRSADKTAPLAARGAIACPDPADAVRGAERVHLVLSEDAAVDAVCARLRPGLASGTPVIDHSTNAPALVAARWSALRAEGVRYVPAPVFMSPANARDASGLMLLAGPADDHELLASALATMTGKLLYVGERVDLAAVWKLAGNSVFFAMAAAMADVLAIGAGAGVTAESMLALFDTFKPGTALPFLGQRVAKAGSGPASFELAMARKDARSLAAGGVGHRLLVLPSVIAAMDRAIAAGAAHADYAVFTKST